MVIERREMRSCDTFIRFIPGQCQRRARQFVAPKPSGLLGGARSCAAQLRSICGTAYSICGIAANEPLTRNVINGNAGRHFSILAAWPVPFSCRHILSSLCDPYHISAVAFFTLPFKDLEVIKRSGRPPVANWRG
jgi:hypothetical protein